MKSNILENHGPLCALYQAYKGGDDNEGWSAGNPKQKGSFRSEGDSPAFLHTINTGLRNMESPDYGGWGGRYVKVRGNTWLDPVPFEGYEYPEGRWYTRSAWGRNYMRDDYPEDQHKMEEYFRPLTRWVDAIQSDFAARADWCVKSYEEANHPPVVKVQTPLNMTVGAGDQLRLSAKETFDPDGNQLSFHWWQYEEVGTFSGKVKFDTSDNEETLVNIPQSIKPGETIHVICEVKDNGEPGLTRYRRIVITLE